MSNITMLSNIAKETGDDEAVKAFSRFLANHIFELLDDTYFDYVSQKLNTEVTEKQFIEATIAASTHAVIQLLLDKKLGFSFSKTEVSLKDILRGKK
ncbi:MULTISPECIES: hypothetical protein [Burkholderia]|uniref:hypothetical protein n=1 Tax=Burkholderia TaxID=32008 RepID=UPI00117CEF5B|nr:MULTISPECIES: hypothetical protein [Burkholderia]